MCDQQSLRSACTYTQSDQSYSLEYFIIAKLLTEHHLEFLSLKGGCRGSSESTLIKITNCWKSHATDHITQYNNFLSQNENSVKLPVNFEIFQENVSVQAGCLGYNLNKFSFFKREKERETLYLSVDKLWPRTLAATGVSKTTVYNIVLSKEQSASASANMQLDGACSALPVLESLSTRPACRTLDKFNQDLVRRTVFAFHSERIPPNSCKK